MTDTYVIGLGNAKDGKRDDIFVQFEAGSNDEVYPQLAHFVARDYNGVLDLEGMDPVDVARLFIKSYGFDEGTLHRNHIPHSDHTVHLYDVDSMTVILVGDYDPNEPQVDAKVAFGPSQFFKRYGY